jgi:hypothetical protein
MPEVAKGLAAQAVASLKTPLEEAQRAGLRVDVPLYVGGMVGQNLGLSLQKITAYARQPAVLSWKIIDEPDLRTGVMDEVPAAYTRLVRP